MTNCKDPCENSVKNDPTQRQTEEELQEFLSLAAKKSPLAVISLNPIHTLPVLTEITKLDLFNTNISSLPSNLPTYLPNLSVLFCMKNKFTTVPAVIGQCPKLQMVSFKSNNIREIHPDALNSQLRWLILTDNQLTSIPSTIGKCIHLQKCMLSGNCLESLPLEIANCHNLELIRLASNRLKEPPMSLLNLPKLSWVAFSGNPFLFQHCGSSGAQVQKTTWEKHSVPLKEFSHEELDDPSKGIELGMGASGITRKYTLKTLKCNFDNVDDDENVKESVDVAVKEYYSTMTSDGNPQEERKISMIASSLGCQSLIKVLGQTKKGSLVMELLTDYKVLAGPPSMETCSRDVYDEGMKISVKRAASMVEHLLYALMKLHEQGICHGDFYGHNILISNVYEDRVWLTDFGAAFLYDEKSQYGKLVEAIERRAFGHLIREICDLVESDGDDGNFRRNLEDLATLCAQKTFHQLYHDVWTTCKESMK
jgi:hypothetical protein